MLNIRLFLAFAFLSGATAAHALTPEDIARIKASATAISSTAASAQNRFDTGNQSNSEGEGSAAAPAKSQVGYGADYVKKMYGIDAVTATGNPAAGAGVAGGAVQASKYVDFQCGQDEGRTRSAGGVTVKLGECLGLAPNGMLLAVCDAPLTGGACTQDAYTQVTLAAGKYQRINESLEAGFACNSAKACRVTLRTSFSQSGTGADMQAKTQDAAAAPTALAAKLQNMYTSDNYAEHYSKTGREMSDCVQGVNASLNADGTASTCGGSATIKTTGESAATDSSNCTESWSCLREATQTATYAKSCTRTFPLTTLSCSWSVPTLECRNTRANGVVTSSCTPESLAGGTKVGSTPEACETKAADGTCTTATWTDSYTFMAKATRVGDCASAPAPLAGPPATACASAAFTGCEADGWWLRTLSENECTVNRVENGENVLVQLTASEKPGCGVCVKPISTATCDAKPTVQEPADSCGWIDPVACQLAADPVAESTLDGKVASQREDYVCHTSETTCVERKRVSSCVGTGSHDMENYPVQTASNPQVMNEAMAHAAIMDEMSKSGVDGDSGDLPRIFTASDSRCKKPSGYATSYSDDCCKISLTQDNVSSCGTPRVKLASSRRANRTHYVGEYCSKSVGIGKFKKCTEKTQTYCEYDGLLGRIVQEQGREQLATMAASPLANPEKTPLVFAYYGNATGSWTAPIEVGGVKVAAWQTPSACKDPGSAGAAEVNCPSILTQWFAVCEMASGCGDLPFVPEAGSDTWTLGATDPLTSKLQALSHRTTIEGACDTSTSTCRYTVTALPDGSGGRARITRSLNFQLATQDAEGKPVAGGVTMLGDIYVRPYSQPGPLGGVQTPAPIEVSLNGGQTWKAATLPQKIQGSMKLPLTDVDVVGGCDPVANMCSYQVTGYVQVTAKPWGTPKNPDCTGFSIGQLSLLDFSKMDLSEWIASVMGKLSAPDVTGMAKAGAQQGQNFFNVYQSTPTADARPRQTATAPNGAKTADVTPKEGWGPFDALLRVSSNYPEIYTSTEDGRPDPQLNTDPISAVEVDWGDCTVSEFASQYSGYLPGPNNVQYPASGFTATHRYLAPTQIACTDRGPHDLTHTVRITIHSKSGTHQTSVNVKNLWTGDTGPSGVGDGAGGRSPIILQDTR